MPNRAPVLVVALLACSSAAFAASCGISTPTPFSDLYVGDPIVFSADEAGGRPVGTTFSYSIDGGATWVLMTAAPGYTNPHGGRSGPIMGGLFGWDTVTDGVGTTGPQVVGVQLIASGGSGSSVCTVLNVTVFDPDPSCAITSPAPGATASADVSITFDSDGDHPEDHEHWFSFSLDGGSTWSACTTAAASAVPNLWLVAMPVSGATYVWDSITDGVGATGPVPVRLRLEVVPEKTSFVGECTVDLVVDNRPVECLIQSPAPGAPLAGAVTVTFDGDQIATLPVTSTFQFSLDAGVTWSAATAAATSAVANPDAPRATPFAGVDFLWDTSADSLGAGGAEVVDLRILVDDGTNQATCETNGLVIDNQPTCAITSPGPGATAAGDVSFTFDALDPSDDPVTSTFDYSVDGGATWFAATPAPASPTGNPDPLRPTPITARVFVWSSQLDGVGLAGGESVDFRVTIDDGLGSSSCSVSMVMVDNVPSCSITAPAPGASVTGAVALTFAGVDPSNDPLTSTFEFSVDAGATWLLGTPAAGSPTTNPDPARATPFAGVSFFWDSQADAVGLTGAQQAALRVFVDDGSTSGSCSLVVQVDNQPSCSIVSPAPGARAGLTVDVIYDATDPANDIVTATIELSLDGGVTWQLATPTAGSATSNPQAGLATPVAGVSFEWDTATDLGATAPPGAPLLRLTIQDGTASGSCQGDVIFGCLDCGDCNASLDGIIDVLDALEAATIDVGITTPNAWHVACCDVNASGRVNILDALIIAQETVALPVTLLCQ